MDQIEQIRQTFSKTLKTICPNVYYNPPPSLKIKYPCIVYLIDGVDNTHASNNVYKQNIRFLVTSIDNDVSNPNGAKISLLLGSRFSRNYNADGLNHMVYVVSANY